MSVVIVKQQDFYRIQFPYDPAVVERIRPIPGRLFEKASKTWVVPVRNAKFMADFVKVLRASQRQVLMDGAQEREMNALAVAHNESLEASRMEGIDTDIPVPAGLDYMPFQKAGIAYALARPNTLFGDEMGLGKTIQAIGFSNCSPALRSVLIVCPASLRLNWRNEWAKWDVKGLTIGLALTDHRLPQTDVVIINYDIVPKLSALLHERAWDLLICDEAHYMKSGKALRTLHVLGGRRKIKDPKAIKPAFEEFKALPAKRKLFLTGTPILNKPIEAWTLVHALAPSVFHTYGTYAWRYCGASSGKYGFDAKGASNLDELQEILRANIMVRRLKKDVLKELPAKQRQVVEIPSDASEIGAENRAYAGLKEKIAALKLAVELAKGGTDAEYSAAVICLKQGISVAMTEMSKLRHATALVKVPLVISHVQDAIENHGKVILFAHHKDVIALIAAAFPGCVIITGDVDKDKRQEIVRQFQEDPKVQLFIGNIQAAGVGLTLTASSHVVFAELDWVPGNISQAEDRAHRMGQKDSVLVQHLVLEGSLDATMAKRVIGKQAMIDKALDNRDADLSDEPLLPLREKEVPATDNVTQKTIAKEAESLTPEQVGAIHAGLRMLSGMCDGANTLDGAGFSKIDTDIGHSLGGCNYLTVRQAALGKRLITKYRRQLPAEILATAGVSK